MDYGWFAYQCNTGETLFFYNKFSGEYRWLSCTCVQKASATLSKEENTTETMTEEESQGNACVRSIGTETDSTLSTPLHTTTKELRTQGTQTDLTDLVPSTTPISNDEICMKEVDCNLSSNQLPMNPNVLPDERRESRGSPNAEEKSTIDNRNITKAGNKIKLFPCCFCTKAFTSYTFLSKHMKCHATLHNQALFKTGVDSNHVVPSDAGIENVSDHHQGDTASEKTAESPSLEASLFGFPSNNSLQCFQCHLTFTSSKALDDHFGALHYEDVRCEACQKTFSCKKSFKVHLVSHFGEKHHCSHCGKTFPVRLGLLRHQRFKHNPFWNDDLLKQLKKLETPNSKCTEVNNQDAVTGQQLTFKCDSCSIAYGLYSELVEHQKKCKKTQAKNNQDNPEQRPVFYKKRYWCYLCNSSYNSYKSLARHKKSKSHKTNERSSETLHANKQNAIPCNSSYCCQSCNSSFKDYNSLVQHKKLNNCFEKTTHIENNIFKCMLCTDTFFSVAAIARHIVTHIGPDQDAAYPCNLCKKRFRNKDALERHLFYHLQVNNCSHCNKSFDRLDQLSEHNKTVHSASGNFTCTVCNKKFMQLAGLSNHYRSHKKMESPGCSFCGKTFIFDKNLNKHVRRCRNKSSNSSTSREKEVIKSEVPNDNLIPHLKKEARNGNSKGDDSPPAIIQNHSLQYNGVISSVSEKMKKDKTAPQCPNLRERKFDSQPVNTQGSYFNSKERKFQCFKCKKFFTSKYYLLKHQEETQHGKKPKSLAKRFKCQVCKKAFQSYSVFYQHQLQHNSRKSHKCRRCGTCFTSAKLLSSHKCTISTTKRKEFECKLCRSVFSTGQGLSNHRRGLQCRDRVFDCKCCNRVFENAKRLQKHKKTEKHSQNEKKNETVAAKKTLYECCTCGKVLSAKNHLQRHKTTCTSSKTKASTSKQKPQIQCFTCDHSFKEFSLFQEHFASTHGEGNPCWLCPKRFSTYSNLNRHVKDAHHHEKQFFCNWCFRELFSVADYMTHTGHSNGESRHMCNICESRFDLCSSLIDHNKTYHTSQ